MLANHDSFAASLPSHRAATDPARWQAKSAARLSQELTHTLRTKHFGAYVELFGYGNRVIAGNPGKSDGLVCSWLSSSLVIAPAKQIAFLTRVRTRALGVLGRA